MMAPPVWNWDKFRGSKFALKYARRDLVYLDTVVGHTPRRRVAVQAGGSLGIFPKRLAQFFDAVYTYEPDPATFRDLVANVPEPNVFRFEAALGAHGGMVGLSRHRRDGSQGPIHEGLTHVSGSGVVPLVPLDGLQLPICDLLYLDLEGFEFDAVHGALDTIKRCRPVIAIEVNQNIGFYGRTQDEIRSLVCDQGYRFIERLMSDELFFPMEQAA